MSSPLRVPSRDAALDATRTVAIWLMVTCHVSRLISKRARPEWMKFGMLIEPLTSFIVPTIYCGYIEFKMRLGFRDGRWATAEDDSSESLAHAA